MSSVDDVAAVLEAAPGRTAAQIRDALRSTGRVSFTTSDVGRILITFPRRFRHDGAQPPRWWPTGAQRPVAADPTAPPSTARLDPPAPGPLYVWQVDALAAWRRHGRRGVVEAVTGAGKTTVGVAAVVEEVARLGQACVVVPTTELLRQWASVLAPRLAPGVSMGLLGDGNGASLGRVDVLVAVVNSARGADLRPRRPGGLLVADECHRYGSEGNRLALEAGFDARLGLSATYARADDGHLTWLEPYFGATCFRLGYARAIADDVIARVRVALVAVPFGPGERAQYEDLSRVMSGARARLVSRHGVAAEPIGRFLEAVARLARGAGAGGDAAAVARQYLWAMQDRRRLLAETPAKGAALARLAPAVRASERTIVFTQSIAGAERAATALGDCGVAASAVHSALGRDARRSVLARYGSGDLAVVTAPQVLDEGVDVPAADLGIILGASHSRRQMIQRMGRVLRRKPDGRPARFAIVFVEGTTEDPALGAHAAFLDEVTAVADKVVTFPIGAAADEVCSFLEGGPTRGVAGGPPGAPTGHQVIAGGDAATGAASSWHTATMPSHSHRYEFGSPRGGWPRFGPDGTRLREDEEPVRCASCGQALGAGPDGGGSVPAAGTGPEATDGRAGHVCPEGEAPQPGSDGPGAEGSGVRR